MKKIVFSVLLLTLGGGIAAFAQNVQATIMEAPPVPGAAVSMSTQPEKSSVEPADLPEAVRTTLAGDAYKEWTVLAAWRVKDTATYYELQVKKGEDVQMIRVDENGKPLS